MYEEIAMSGIPEKDRVAIMKRVETAMEKVKDGETDGQRAVRVMGFLETMSKEMGHAGGLTDEQLIDEIFEKIWGELDMSSPESALLEELILRFKKAADVDNVS
jgi:hypothetical protein